MSVKTKMAVVVTLLACLFIGLAAADAQPRTKIRYALGDVITTDDLQLLIAIERAKARGVDVEVTAFKSEELAKSERPELTSLSPDMGFNPKSGYNFALLPGAGALVGPADCTGQPTLTGYYASGTPLGPTSGTRAFATNTQGTVWQDTTGVPPIEPFTPGATVSPIQ